MKNRNPLAVVGLSIITFGIYGIYWFASTKGEMNQRGETIPTTWLIIVPIVQFYWYWKYSEGVEHVTGAKISKVEAFLLLILIGIIGMPIIQSAFNKLGASGTVDAMPAPGAVGGAMPPNETTLVPAQPISPDATPITPTGVDPTPPIAPTPPADLSGPDVSAPPTNPALPPENGVPPSLTPDSGSSAQPDDPQSIPPNPPLVQ